MSFDSRPLTLTDAELAETTALLRRVFPKAAHFTERYLAWLYRDNPSGQAVGFNAVEGGRIIGHYVTVPLRARLFGSEARGLLSLNTATDPDHAGKGIFTKLAGLTYERARAQGYEFVVGVANQNSSFGFVKKLGFQHVAPLNVRVGAGRLGTKRPEPPAGEVREFERLWSGEEFAWRLKNPSAQYTKARSATAPRLLARTTIWGLPALMLDFDSEPSMATSLTPRLAALEKAPRHWLELWLGLDPSIDWAGSKWVNIPMRLRPSPLNLIFRDLSPKNRQLDPRSVRFRTMDFDAY